MLIASYFVGRDKNDAAVCIVVSGVFLDGYIAKENDLIFNAGRTDLVHTFEQDGHSDGFILPDLPVDIVNLLSNGESINIVDIDANQAFVCAIGVASEISL